MTGDDYTTPDDKTTTKQYEYFNKPQTKVRSIQKSGQTKQSQLKFKENNTEAASKLSKKGKPQKHKINPKYHLFELQRQRLEIGTWVQCTDCDKWRYLSTITDPQKVELNWKCSMNPNSNFSSCEAKEILPPALEEQDMIYSPFSVGSLVWVLQPGYPWWPAMVDDDPDTEQFYWLNDYSDIPVL
ncbi:hypothetical protein B566_EDAN003665 [Ephemera danica]|nr:hypothetical protein B566_EDAN003665 [Ephemera danica]